MAINSTSCTLYLLNSLCFWQGIVLGLLTKDPQNESLRKKVLNPIFASVGSLERGLSKIVLLQIDDRGYPRNQN